MPTALLLYRKTRPSGNFSIEISFDRMKAAFPAVAPAGWAIEKFSSSYFSNGLLDRLRAIREAARQTADVYHITGDVHYLALGLPGRRCLLTIHDCGFFHDARGLKRALLKLFWLSWPVRRCRLITAVSEATRTDIIQLTHCPPHKVRVVPTLIAGHFKRAPRPFGQDRPVVLHIGLAPNKNFHRHVAALAGLPVKLRVIGKPEPSHLALVNQHQLDCQFDYNLSEAEMQDAYANCDLLLFASTLEGFGMPILEAQSVGRPVVTSHCSSMPEVAGGAAFLVDPFEVSSIRAGVLRVIQDAPYREELIAKGFENIKRYQPEAVAEQYAALYAELLAS